MAVMIRHLVDRAARAYVAGPELADALRTTRALGDRGLLATIAYWNESGDPPDEVLARYLEAIDGARAHAGCYVSIKVPAIAGSKERFAALAAHAASNGVGLHLDALAAEDQTTGLDLLAAHRTLGTYLGCTLPGRWARSLDDAERALELGLHVRVVKGQWEAPLGGERDPYGGFLDVVTRLSGRAVEVAVATHDPRLAEESIRRLHARGTPVTLELLYGLPTRAARTVAAKLGAPVRLYVPFGRAWLPYSLRQASKNPKIIWWILEDAVRGRSLSPEGRV